MTASIGTDYRQRVNVIPLEGGDVALELVSPDGDSLEVRLRPTQADRVATALLDAAKPIGSRRAEP